MRLRNKTLALIFALAPLGACDSGSDDGDGDGTTTSTDPDTSGSPTTLPPTTETASETMTMTNGDTTGGDTTGDPPGTDTGEPATDSGMATDSGGTDSGGTDSGTDTGGSDTGGSDSGGMNDAYGPCMDDMDCQAGELCLLVEGVVSFCSLENCMNVNACADPADGDSVPTCDQLTMDPVDFCFLDCSGGQTCPTGMVCEIGACAWPK